MTESPRKQRLSIALLLNALIAVLYYGCATPIFETNDDITMMHIASGIRNGGPPSEFLVFSNVLIGQGLTALFERWPEVNWYSLYLLAAHFSAMTALLYVLLRAEPLWTGLIKYAVLFLFFEAPQLLRLQFTSTAATVAIAGFFVLMSRGDAAERRPWPELLAGSALIAVGGLIRGEALALVMVLCAPLAVPFVGPANRRIIGAFVLAVGFLLAAFAYDRAAYQDNEAWRSYQVFNATRSNLLDNPTIDEGPELEAVLQDVGWSTNDYQLFKAWLFLDPRVYSTEKLERLRARVSTAASWPDAAATLGAVIKRNGLMVLLTIGSFVVLLMSGQLRRAHVIAIGTAGVALVVLAVTAKLPDRVMWPILFFVNGVLLIRRESALRGWRAAGWAVALSALCLAQLWTVYSFDRLNRADAARYDAVMKRLRPSANDLYISWGGTLRVQDVSAFDSAFKYEPFNYLVTGWTTNSPLNTNVLKKFGIQDLDDALIHDKRVFLIADPDDLGLLSRHIEEHHKHVVRFKTIHDFGDFVVVQVER